MWKIKHLKKSASSDPVSSDTQESKGVNIRIDSPDAPRSLTESVMRRKAPSAAQWAAVGAYTVSPALYRVVNPIAHAMATLEVWTETKEGKPIGDLGFDALMEDPNEYMSAYQYRHLQALYQIVEGESLGWLIEDSTREAGYQILPLPPHDCTLVETQDQERKWEVILNDRIVLIDFEDVVWMKTADPVAPYDRGVGVGKLIADEIQIDEYAAEHIKQTLYNRAIPDHVIHVKGASKDAIEGLKTKWKQRFGGPTKRGIPLFSSDDQNDLQIQKLTESFEDLGLVDLRKFCMTIVREALNVPPEIVGETESSNLAKSLTAETHFGKYVINPRMTQMVSEWESRLLPALGTNPSVSVGFESPIPEDREFNLKVAQAFSSGVPPHMTVNEARAMQGLPPRQDGDVYLRDPFKATIEAADEQKAHNPVYEIDLDALEKGLVAPTINKALDEDDLRVLAEKIDFGPYEESISEELQGTALNFAEQQLRTLDVDTLEEALEKIRPGIQAFIDQRMGDEIKNVEDHTKDIVKQEVRRGLEEGKNPNDIAREIDNKLKTMNRVRARRIARTESLVAASIGKHNALENSEVVRFKQWITEIDSETRADHARLNGSVVRLDENFDAGAWKPKHPGDGPVDQVVNCRCAIAGVVDPDQVKSPDEMRSIWMQYDKALSDSEQNLLTFFEGVLEDVRKKAMQSLGD